MNKEVTITIDGAEIRACGGQTILQAADAAGIYIPRLCYQKDLLPGGHCRICTVKVNGRPASACTFPVAQGLAIENATEEMNAFRRTVIEMLFAEGNHICPVCEASGSCELQAMAYRLGLLVPQMPYLHRKRELDASHPDVYLDRNRCMLCGRCVRASRQLDGKPVFAFEGRGNHMVVASDAPEGLGGTNLSVADRAAEICPTGSLTVKRRGYRIPVGQRPYDKTPIGADVEAKRNAECAETL